MAEEMTNGEYIRSLDNKRLSVALGDIIDEFMKARHDPTYTYTLDEQIKAAHDWLNKPLNHNGKMVKGICGRLEG